MPERCMLVPIQLYHHQVEWNPCEWLARTMSYPEPMCLTARLARPLESSSSI